MYTGQNVYATGARFSLAGMRTMYGARGLGDCLDPSQAGDASCGQDSGGGVDLTTLISQGLTDVTQLLRPGTPSPVRVFTPTSTAAGSLFSSPLLLLALVGGAVYLARR